MVKDDLANMKSAWIWYIILALGYWVLFLMSSSYATNPGYLVFMAFWGGYAIFSFVHMRRWKPINERRQMAAAWGFAARVPLAQSHPLPNVGALPLPFTIILKPNWPKFLFTLGMMVGAAIIVLAAFFPFVVGSEGFLLSSGVWLLLLFMFVGVCAIISLWLRPQRIETTQEGLTVIHAIGKWHGTNWIRWSDARLFAIRGGKLGMPGTLYELSSPYAVVQWTRTRGRRWSLHRPAIPFAEYDAQMDALIALISGVTGLPLYDVR
ncbi:MAG TPA: hypothetical protein VFU69_14010 [Ktedonobacterales bacterium]|nr:hypothetical protein [Ktedonobacterales bacterium]